MTRLATISRFIPRSFLMQPARCAAWPTAACTDYACGEHPPAPNFAASAPALYLVAVLAQTGLSVLALVNVAAGSARNGENPGEFLRKLFFEEGITADVQVLSGPQLRQRAELAAREGRALVAAVGGDGTLNAVASGLVGTSTALGIVPAGTHNHFAKDAGVPLDPKQAVRTIAAGKRRAVDVGEVNETIFLNNASIGVYVRVLEEREALLEFLPRPKWLATAWSALRVLHRSPVMHFDLNLSGHRVHRRTPFLFVGNNPYEIDLLRLRQRPRLDRGQLSVFYLARCRTRFCLYRLIWLTLLKRLNQAEDFEAHCLDQLEVGGHGSTVRVALDGEVHCMQWPLRFRSRAGALKVLVPETAAHS